MSPSSTDTEASALGLEFSSHHLGLSRNAERVASHMRGWSFGREVRNRSVSSTVERESCASARTPNTSRASDTFRGILTLRQRTTVFSVSQACRCRREVQTLLPALCLPSYPSRLPRSSTRVPRERCSLKPHHSDFERSRVPRCRSCGECRFPSPTIATDNQCNRKIGHTTHQRPRLALFFPFFRVCPNQEKSAKRSVATCPLTSEQRAQRPASQGSTFKWV